MALTRSMLKAMGIEDEKIDQIIDEHSETVESLKQQRDENKDAADEVLETKHRLAEVESQLEESKRYKAKYEESQKTLEELKASYASEKDKAQRETLYRNLLREAGIADKRIDSVLKVTDLSPLEIGEDGSLSNAEALKEAITKEWADFIPSTETRGAKVDNPPAGAKGAMSKDEILAIDDKGERQAAIAENHELFGF